MANSLRKRRNTLELNLFWLILFLYLDFGGYQKGLFQNNIAGLVNFSDVFFVILVLIYVINPKSKYVSNRVFISFSTIYALWLLYYIGYYGYLNNSYSFLQFLIKSRSYYYNLVIMYFVSVLIQKDSRIFFRYLIFYSYIIIIAFLLTVTTNLNIVPIQSFDRTLFEGIRHMLYNYSLLPLLIPIGFVLIIFKIKIPESKLLSIGGSAMILIWILSITRRHLLFTLIYGIIVFLIAVRLKQIKFTQFLYLSRILIIPLVLIFFIFPKYISSTAQAFTEIFSIAKTGKTTSGKSDDRLSLTSRDFIIDLIRENPLRGTGYDRRWSTSQGDRQGYEASDYPLIGAIAMYGIVGLLLYFPIYIFIYRRLFRILKKMRYFGIHNVIPQRYDQLLFLSLCAVYLLELMIYTNYFSLAASPSSSLSGSLFVQLGLLLGIFQKFSSSTITRNN